MASSSVLGGPWSWLCSYPCRSVLWGLCPSPGTRREFGSICPVLPSGSIALEQCRSDTYADPDLLSATPWRETDLAVKGLAATLLRRFYDHVEAVSDTLFWILSVAVRDRTPESVRGISGIPTSQISSCPSQVFPAPFPTPIQRQIRKILRNSWELEFVKPIAPQLIWEEMGRSEKTLERRGRDSNPRQKLPPVTP